jgi:hypothetical protein
MPCSGFGGLVVSMLASGTLVRRFEPGRNRRIFSGEKFHSKPSFGREVKPSVSCRRFAACKIPVIYMDVRIAGQIDQPFLARLSPALTEAWRGAPLEMTGRPKGGAQRARTFKGLGAMGWYPRNHDPNLPSTIYPIPCNMFLAKTHLQ